ncbi:MAG: 1,4-alpha-glucan branching protein GlgB [Clostridia bacterium]|nr:1,4-alpha-glucan branching protein GlgB [Clostridia bacterium]
MANELGRYYFNQGTTTYAYYFLGCTLKRVFSKYRYTFRVWAPNAYSVNLISDFTDWSYGAPMIHTDGGIFEISLLLDHHIERQAYKFRVTSASGTHDKGDPFARFSRGGADGAPLVYTDKSFKFEDGIYRRQLRNKFNKIGYDYPINIYEVHLGSFLRHDDGTVLSYREMADVLIPYVKSMGYTHIELLPLAEFPFDGSWGYQVCGFYAPTSRYGEPNDFKYFINLAHKMGIGIILDWVPAHFPKDEWGLYEFDGSPLYEYQGQDRMESASWGTRFFDLGREEVQSFLISNALFWLREYHIDGLRVDAVASMLYLDYDRLPGEWIPNANGDNINLEAVAFFKKLSSSIKSEFPESLLIAEESGSYGGITSVNGRFGLGFDMKWNMGYANDIYDYLSCDPALRHGNHKALNFPLMYAFNERYCLPISHDEVVHGKKSFIDKMYGNYEDKFLTARAALLLMYSYPGKKLTFMGTEYAQFREWDFDDSLEWFMTDYPIHSDFRLYVKSLNELYLSRDEFWDLDFSPDGFEWIYPDLANENLVAYKRKNKRGEELIFVISFNGSDISLEIPGFENDKLEVVFESTLGAAQVDKTTLKLKRLSGTVLRLTDGSVKIKRNK